MGVQVVLIGHEANPKATFVVGGQVVYDVSAPSVEDRLAPWMSTGDARERKNDFAGWLEGLPEVEDQLASGRVADIRYSIAPTGPFASSPAAPPVIFGHLPFVGTSDEGEVFYRWEPFPTSKRVDQGTGDISPGTYTAPASEAQFVASGFGAVGRFATPFLSPACWRWELRPPAGTPFRCGASVPLYGQSGGGVEAMFPTGFKNVGPIANQFILPAL